MLLIFFSHSIAVAVSRFSLTTYPAVPGFFSHLPCYALNIFFRTPLLVPISRFSRTLLCPYFFSQLPAVHLFFFALTCCALLILFSLTLLYQFPAFRLPLTRLWPYLFYFHLPCCTHFPLFAYHLPCCALTYFTFTYPAVRFSRFSLTTYPVRRKIRAQQGKRKAQQGTEYGVSA